MTATRWSWLRDLRSWRWPVLAVGLKVFLYGFLIWQANRTAPAESGPSAGFAFFQHSGDESSYLLPAENLLEHGIYAADLSRVETRAGRMPGYGFTYLAFRWFTTPNTARTLLVLFQVLLSGLSVYYLALIGWMVFRTTLVFYATFALYGASLFVSVWDPMLLTESLGTSSVIFFLYHLFRYRDERRASAIFWAGFFYAYSVSLRPFLAPLALVALPYLVDRLRLAASARRLAIFGICIALIECPWMIRNYSLFKRIIPLQYNLTAGYDFSEADLSVRAWLQAVGEDSTWWARGGLAPWLKKSAPFHDEGYQVSPSVLTSSYGLDELRAARDLYSDSVIEADPIRKQELSAEAARRFGTFRSAFIRERPFRYHVVAPLRLLAAFLITTGPVLPLRPFRQLLHDPLSLSFKLGAVFLYWFVLTTGLIGLALLAPSRDPATWIMVAPLVLVLILFPFIIRMAELRFLTSGYPSLCLTSAYCIDRLAARLRLRLRRAPSLP